MHGAERLATFGLPTSKACKPSQARKGMDRVRVGVDAGQDKVREQRVVAATEVKAAHTNTRALTPQYSMPQLEGAENDPNQQPR